MTGRDPELIRLLIDELERHLATLVSATATAEEHRRTLHALKGSAGLAGERELSASLQRLERRMRGGDDEALGVAVELVRTAIVRLRAGAGAVEATWPEPPDDLVPTPIDPRVRVQYSAELVDRLARIDDALARTDDPIEAVTEVFRHVHTIKGASSAAGDDPMTWFCHGLEERLRHAGATRDAAVTALGEVGRFRPVLASLLDDAAGALVSLRSMGRRRPSQTFASVRPKDDEAPKSIAPDEGTIRVATTSVDNLLDRIVEISLVREQVSSRADAKREQAQQLRRLRGDLAEALRLIGPPRPWGAPAAALRKIERVAAALSALGDDLEQASHALRGSDARLREGTAGAKRELAAMRQVPLRTLFLRVSQAIEAESKRLGRLVHVRTRGGDETIDRRLAELLAEPCLHIARNSVAHGIEPPEERAAAGKAATATVSLTARKSAGRLVLGIADDGRGVDVASVRQKAVESGAVTEAMATAADDDTLLGLLFLPGFSTREGADLLAGRGIGLDLALASVQRLGGAVRLWSRRGMGFEARLDVPVESGLVTVLWVEAAGVELALAAAHARAIRKTEPGEAIAPLASCLARPAPLSSSAATPYAVELDVGEDEGAPLRVGIDRIGRMEEVLVRPLSSLVTSVGPFAGAIVRGDGSLRLALDAYALAPRARALEAAGR